MKITAFNGSPRGKNGNTHIMVEELSRGMQEAGAEFENIFLTNYVIQHCRGCFSCWIKTPGECVIKDDVKQLLPKLVSSDIVIFATPVYVDNVTGIMKNFMDRFLPLLNPHFEKDDGGESKHSLRHGKSPKVVVISNCGFPEQSHFQVLRLLFKRIARNMNSEVIAEIYRGGGGILEDPPLALKPFIWKYKKVLKRAGGEIIKNLKLSDETVSELAKPIIPDDMYIKGANKYWDKELKKISIKV